MKCIAIGSMAAVERGIIEIVEYLLLKGYDINHERVIEEGHFEFIERALNIALCTPDSTILKYLLSIDSLDVNYSFQPTFGNTLVHFACGDEKVSSENLGIFLSLILNAGADVNAFGSDNHDTLKVLRNAGRHKRKDIGDIAQILK